MHALIFDLDGTLVDTVYSHVLAWQRALAEEGVAVDGVRFQRHIGSSGDLIIRFAQRLSGVTLTAEQVKTVRRRHEELFHQWVPKHLPLHGAAELLAMLRQAKYPHAVATASYRPLIDSSLAAVGIDGDTTVIEGGGRLPGKPEPDLFLAARDKLGIDAGRCIVVGDAVWDHISARRAGMQSVGVLTGGYGAEELYHAGAFRVYRDAADLLAHLDELGILI